jgi:hypothetical protein
LYGSPIDEHKLAIDWITLHGVLKVACPSTVGTAAGDFWSLSMIVDVDSPPVYLDRNDVRQFAFGG